MSNQNEITGISFCMGNACFLLMLAAAVLMIPFSEAAASGAAKGLKAFTSTVLPSLFPFVVCSNYLLRSPFIRKAAGKKSVLSSILYPLFTALCGIPSSAVLMNGLCSSEAFDKKSASFLCAVYTQSGPLFIISALSSGFLKCKAYAPAFMLASYLPPAIVSLVFCTVTKKNRGLSSASTSESSILQGPTIVETIADASLVMLRICGTIVFFSVIFSVSEALGLFKLFPGELSALIKGGIEMTNGIYALSSAPSRLSLSLIAFLLSFGGLSVFVQLKMIFPELSAWIYIPTKLILGTISAVIFLLSFPLIPIPVETMGSLSESLPSVAERAGKRFFYVVSATVPLIMTLVISLVSTRFLKKEKGR